MANSKISQLPDATVPLAGEDYIAVVQGYGTEPSTKKVKITDLKQSVQNDRFKGKYTSLNALETAYPTANAGDYAQVDEGAGSDVINYNWDSEDGWIEGGSGSAATTTDELPEGSFNLYYTDERAQNANIGALASKANDADVVHKAGLETITGSKLFTAAINFQSSVISTDGYYFFNNAKYLKLSAPNTSANHEITLPNADGTLALTSDIPTTVKASDSDLQTQSTPSEDNKIVSRHGLIYYWNWLKGQVVNITARWQFTGIGIGTAGVTDAFIKVAASTASVASFLVTFGASYTGTNSGSIWGESTGYRLRMLRGSIASDFLFTYDNYLYKGVGTRVAMFTEAGDLIAVDAVEQGFATDSDVITAIIGATYTDDRATITPANNKVFYQGQMYDDGIYLYLAIDDNLIFRSGSIESKTDKNLSVNNQTASYTLALTDNGKMIEMNVALANNLTIPLNSSVAFPIGAQIIIYQMGAGNTTVVATSGVTLRQRESKLKTAGQYALATLIKRDTDTWVLSGDLMS